MILGVWLITSAFALAYRSPRLQVSDVASGTLVILLAALSLSRRPFWKLWAPWANSLVGMWLLFAPLLFRAPTAAAYANDTVIGALVIVFAILAPGMPMARGMSMEGSANVPPGWSYNPSSWPQRAPVIALALVGFLLSRQMASFELHYIPAIPDPFFGLGTQRVLTSAVSRSFPIPDAGLGAFAYMVEFLMGFMGDKHRWRTMPWMVTFFGILVVPLGIVSISLIILQPLAVGAWCTPCLIAASAMLIMIALTLDEVVAMMQFLVQARREGQPLWRTFWLGGTLRDLAETGPVRPDVMSPGAMVWGVALPWNLLLTVGLGLWLMLTPSVLGSARAAAHSEHLVGALIVSTAVIALSDVGRPVRFINILFGAWVLVAPLLLGGATTASRWGDGIVAVLVILLSLPRGPIGERYGTWDRLVSWPRRTAPQVPGNEYSQIRVAPKRAAVKRSNKIAKPSQPVPAKRGAAIRPHPGIIIVTGSNGRIGDAVMRRFTGRFDAVVGFDRKALGPPPPGCVVVPVEITSNDSVLGGLRSIREHHGAHIVSVIHLAAYYDFFGKPSSKYQEITVQGTGRLLRGLRALDFKVDQFVFSSTMLVHRPVEPGEFISEDSPVEPTWAYPASKVRTEHVIHDERGDIPAVLLRISGVYDDLAHSIPLAHQIQRINEREMTSRMYSGSTAHGQSFMHMDDLVDAIELVVERRKRLPPELALLLGEPEAISYDELQHTIARLIRAEGQETIEIPLGLAPLAKAGAWVLDHVPGQEGFVKPWMIDRANDHYALDITRAQTLLGWEPRRSLRETLPKMVAALKADPPGFYRENDLEAPASMRQVSPPGDAAAVK